MNILLSSYIIEGWRYNTKDRVHYSITQTLDSSAQKKWISMQGWVWPLPKKQKKIHKKTVDKFKIKLMVQIYPIVGTCSPGTLKLFLPNPNLSYHSQGQWHPRTTFSHALRPLGYIWQCSEDHSVPRLEFRSLDLLGLHDQHKYLILFMSFINYDTLSLITDKKK